MVYRGADYCPVTALKRRGASQCAPIFYLPSLLWLLLDMCSMPSGVGFFPPTTRSNVHLDRAGAMRGAGSLVAPGYTY
jgi:hypothetical protein